MLIPLLIAVGLGAVTGMALAHAKQCAAGACRVTARSTRGAVYGALVGLLLGLGLARGPQVLATETVTSDARKPKIVDVETVEQFKKLVADRDGKALVFFHATWCGPCKRFAPTFEKLAAGHADKAAFVRIDVDKGAALARALRIRGVPTVLFVKDGKEAGRFVGGADEETLEALLTGKATAEERVPRFPRRG
jgi:thioredoxin